MVYSDSLNSWHHSSRQNSLLFWLAFIISSILNAFGTPDEGRTEFMETVLPIAQPLLTMHSTQTWLLLPGNLTGSIQTLPFEQNNKAPLCSLISHYRTLLNHIENWLSWNN